MRNSECSGSVLIGVLWCVVLLTVVVVGLLHTARHDLMVGKYHADRLQAHYLALAGIEKAKALLYQDALTRSRAGVHHGAGLYNAPEQFRDVALGRGQFRVIRAGRDDEGGGVIFGVSDEESRLNVNVATVNHLTNIVGLTSDVAAAIVDWHDGDTAVTPGGAESPYYTSLQPPHLARNGPIPTLRDLLMVRGVTQDLLFGEPPPLPASLLTTAGSGSSSRAVDEPELRPEAGWAALLTAHSAVQNIDAGGVDRVNVQSADVVALTGVRGLTPEIARAIVAYRNQNQLQNLADLMDVTAAPPGGQNPNNNGPNNNNSAAGRKVIDERLFKEIADHLAVNSDSNLSGMINVNTASVEVLMCLPGMNRPLAQAVVAHRRANGFFTNIAMMLDVPGMNRDLFKQLAPMITVRSETFRILSEGRVGSRGSRQRIETIVHIGRSSVTTLAYREDDL